MTEEQQTETVEAPKTETLDDIYSQFQPQTPPAQSAPQQQPAQYHYAPPSQPSEVPDAVTDPDKFRDYVKNLGTDRAALRNDILGEVDSRLNQIASHVQAQSEEREIRDAVSSIKGDLDLDEMVVESYLGARYRQDPKVAQIWDNRHSNPAAYKKFLAFMSNEVQSKFNVKQDPQLTADQRAMDKATKTSQSSSKAPGNDDASEKLLGLNDSEFNQWYAKLLQNG